MSRGEPGWGLLILTVLLLGCGGEGGTAASPSIPAVFQGTIFFRQFALVTFNEDGTSQRRGPDLLASSDGGPVLAVDSAVFNGNTSPSDFSAAVDGRRGAFAIVDGIATVDFSTRPFRYDTLFFGRFTDQRPQIAPDGEHLWWWNNGFEDRVTVTRFDGSLPRQLPQSQGGLRIFRLTWAGPDRIVVVREDHLSRDGTIVLFIEAEEHRISTGVVRDLGIRDSVIGFTELDFFPINVAFNADGTQALWANVSSDVTPETRTTRVTLADSNLRVLQTYEVPYDIGGPIFSPDGRRAVFSTSARTAACHPNCLLFLDLDTGRQTLHTTPPEFGNLEPKAWTSQPLPPIPIP